jgi:uncharacterized protein YdaU (DUF1376 family)
MAKDDYYFPLYYRKILSSTIGWKDDEFGAYVRLLISQFDNGSIPNDLDELALIAPSIKKNWKRLSKKFHDDGNRGLINDVMDEIYQKVQDKKVRNQKNGKKGGRPPKNKNPNESENNPDGFKNETQVKGTLINNNQESITKEEYSVQFTIEHCVTVAMADTRWVKSTSATEEKLLEFNKFLVTQSIYEKNPMDYKKHFANWQNKQPKDSPVPRDTATVISLKEEKARQILNS